MDGYISVLTALLPTGGSFVGAWLAFYVWCPNRRCCQMTTVRGVLEKPRNRKE